MQADPIHIDGTTLEGGGQLLRLTLSLSSIAQIPIHITNIRGKRGPKSNPGQAGGMKPAHLAGAVWLANATDADVAGLEIKSRDLVFQPRDARQFNGEETKELVGPASDLSIGSRKTIWKNVYKDGRLVRRESYIALTTPGSIFLILQAILPYLLLTPPIPTLFETLQPDEKPEPVPISLTIEGGTNVFNSLSYEYASQVLFPMLHTHLGIEPITMTLHRRGWATGRADVGKVTFDIVPLKPGNPIRPFSFNSRGELAAIHMSVIAPSSAFRNKIRDLVIQKLLKAYPGVGITFPVEEDSKHDKRLYLLLVAETSNGYRLGRDWLYDEKINPDKPDKTVDRLVSKVVRDLAQELAHGGCVDEFLQDQLVVFQALADGTSYVDGGKPSLHTQTAQWAADRLLGTTFDGGKCRGIGYKSGQGLWLKDSTSTTEAIERDLEHMTIRG